LRPRLLGWLPPPRSGSRFSLPREPRSRAPHRATTRRHAGIYRTATESGEDRRACSRASVRCIGARLAG
jgi:hypothetical protein